MIRLIASKELRSLLAAPSTWLMLAALQFIFSWFFLARLDAFLQMQPQLALIANAPGAAQTIVAPLFSTLGLIMMMLVPVLTMRLLAEERRNQTMPLLMVLVVVEVILTGGVFAIAGKAGLEQVSWLSPSRWGFAATASTSVLNKLTPPAPGNPADPLWNHNAHAWLLDMGALTALGLAFGIVAWWRLARQGPGRKLA